MKKNGDAMEIGHKLSIKWISGHSKVEMKEGFEPKSFKNYNLTLAEQLELDNFLKENLEKGYI